MSDFSHHFNERVAELHDSVLVEISAKFTDDGVSWKWGVGTMDKGRDEEDGACE